MEVEFPYEQVPICMVYRLITVSECHKKGQNQILLKEIKNLIHPRMSACPRQIKN